MSHDVTFTSEKTFEDHKLDSQLEKKSIFDRYICITQQTGVVAISF